MTTTLRPDEIVRDAIINTFASVSAAADARGLAKDALTEAQGVEGRTREAAYVAFARLAEAHAWDDKTINKGVKLAVATRNDKTVARTMQSLASVLKNAAHPAVRGNIDDLVATRNAAWLLDAEDEAEKLMKWAFSKEQFALEAMMVAIAKGEQDADRLTNTDTLRDWAREVWVEKRLNPKTMAARMKAIGKLLDAFQEEFGLRDNELLVAVNDAISGCDEDWFKDLVPEKAGPVLVEGSAEPNDPAAPDANDADIIDQLNDPLNLAA